MDKRIYLTKILGDFVESGIGRQITGMWSEMIQNRSFRPKSEYKYPMWSWLGLWKDKYNENAPFWHSGYEENDVGIDEFIDEMNLAGSDVEYIIAAYSYGVENLESLLNVVGKKIKHIGYRNSEPEFMEKAIPIVDKFNKENNTQLRLANTEWPAPTYSVEPYEDLELPLNFDWSGRFTNDYKAIFSSYLINWNSVLNTARRTFEHISYGGEHFEPCIAVNLESEKKHFMRC